MQERRAVASIKTAEADAAAKLARSLQGEAAAAESRAREARLRAWPLSVMVSLKMQRIYVRQGFEPVLEMPVVIKEPGKPIGTHAYYATESGEGTRGWLAIALKGGDAETARGALDRIEIPQEVSEKLAGSAWLGSALIVSDEAPYKETAAGTDFIVVLSDQPQGALKIRSPESRDELRPVAEAPRQQDLRGYRAPSQDHHFRHPLGSFP